ncbi:hypothetical protein BJ138DRAFT_1009132 [Hygrophoropsis aurantiaca]|uniref:Uncharacterized protein n=1 Tax=Hygrophoropsis aurantiaca TaxID=72124 RepID=A0ACB8AAA6_9AGAM|nr:hypothetical protein BJ138DRAFT_1009132 [Hygrophoropsis aurantiaca]
MLIFSLDTCRICSAPGEPDQPLFYPCKCSGTIRYIHQDCLTTWLSHSKKKNCDVCKYPYSFQKVYASDMPATIPPLLLVRRLAQHALFAVLFGMRAIMIGIVWLAVLPWITIWTWRVYFTMGESTAWWISGRTRTFPDSYYAVHHNVSMSNQTHTPAGNASVFQQIWTRPFWQTLSADIFTGQIIASLIVLVFVAVFLLREWISQNARPGVFEDDDGDFPAPQNLPADLPRIEIREVVGNEQNGNVPALALRLQQQELLRQRGRMLRARRAMPLQPQAVPDEHVPEVLNMQPPPINDNNRVGAALPPNDMFDTSRDRTEEKLKGKARSHDGVDKGEGSSGVHIPPRTRRRLESDLGETSNDPVFPMELNKSTNNFDDAYSEEDFPRDINEPIARAVYPAAPPISPSLATYRAPEELEAGPSAPNGYFDRRKRTREETEDEYQHYFRPANYQAADDEPAVAGVEGGNQPQAMQDVREPPNIQENIEEEEEEEEEAEDDEDEEGEMPDAEWDVEVEQEEDEEEDAELDVADANQPLPQNELQAAMEQAAQLNDELEGGVEDDMDGIMEAIGLRGPVFGVVQNAVLMIFVLDTAIGFGIWLPFTLGKTTALLSLDPPRFLHILHLPIRAMRIITDPIVDLVTFLVNRFVLPGVLLFCGIIGRMVMRSSAFIVVFFVDKIVGRETSQRAANTFGWMCSRLKTIWTNLEDGISSSGASSSSSFYDPIDAFFESDSPVVKSLEPHFASLGQEIRSTYEHLQSSWVRLTYGHGTNERVFAICLGYAVVAVLLALYLNIFTMGNARSAGRAVRNAVRQQLLVVKVAMFIIIELAVFPFGCGLMLDICTIWIFPEASFQSRVAFFTQACLTAMFYHWVAGTMFMYQFAILLAGCRKIMRPGAMWFIKDPQDQNFHPIRDILDRPTLTQFRKLLISAMMYTIVVACGVGSIAALLFIGSKSIFPLRWKTREPLSDVPVDLLFLQFALPYTMRYFRPRKIFYRASVRVWKAMAAKLRLTSYMFGNRQPSEEYTAKYTSWTAFFLRSDAEDTISKVYDGTFRRVPASDNIALPKDLRATAEVLENGEPVDDTARELIAAQDEEATKAKRDIQKDYITVYFPPRFRSRVIYFILAVWTIVAFTVAFGIALPVQLGRRFFALFTSVSVHDGYSFIVGFYLLWGCYVAARAVDRMDKRRQRRSGDGPRPEFSIFFVKRSLLWVSKISYMILFLGIVLPILLALVVDFYLIMPFRLTLNPTMIPRIRIVDMWALGLVYGKIALRARRPQQTHRIARGFTTITNNGWTHPDPYTATTEVITPLVGGFLGMLALPAVAIWCLRYFWDLPITNKFLFMHVYPGIFAVAGVSRTIIAGVGVISSWSQEVRDKEFLVEMRLQNLEPRDRGLKEQDESDQNGSGDPPLA